jgi:hypothetical protein
MRKQFATAFWQNAHDSLPAQVRARHTLHMQAAERWEMRVAALINAASRAKAALFGPASAARAA